MSHRLISTRHASEDAKKLSGTQMGELARQLPKVLEDERVVKVLPMWTHYESADPALTPGRRSAAAARRP